MNGFYAHGYAGWFVLDIRTLAFVLAFSLLMTLGTVGVLSPGKTRGELIQIGLGLYAVTVIVTVFFFNSVLNYPVFRIESFFPFH